MISILPRLFLISSYSQAWLFFPEISDFRKFLRWSSTNYFIFIQFSDDFWKFQEFSAGSGILATEQTHACIVLYHFRFRHCTGNGWIALRFDFSFKFLRCWSNTCIAFFWLEVLASCILGWGNRLIFDFWFFSLQKGRNLNPGPFFPKFQNHFV